VRLWRAHGLGNDYLVLERGPPMTPALARAVCDRHRGVGGDGVLEPTDGAACDHGVRIWNPDGSVAEKSGNGLRIYARWLHQHRGAPARFSVWTGTDAVQCEVGDTSIRVEMGRATLEPARVPVAVPAPVIDAPWQVDGDALTLTAVGMGNPHAVVFVDPDSDLDGTPWRRWGRALETDARFPNRTNVQIARCPADGGVEIRIWERGAGPTLASGSSACAATVAALATGRRQPGTHRVQMPGGTLEVTVSATLDVLLRGPVEGVGHIEVDPAWLAAR